jgi:predicted DNA-binding antitoxin AbrB/MazE fold protein
MDNIRIEAIYEHGILKLPRELPLAEGQKVTITIYPTGLTIQRQRALMSWNGSQQDLDYLILSEDNDPLEAP